MSKLPVFTRYLYNYSSCIKNLEITIREHLQDETLFWAFELYYSGFRDDATKVCKTSIEHLEIKKRKSAMKKLIKDYETTPNETTFAKMVGNIAMPETSRFIIDYNEQIINKHTPLKNDIRCADISSTKLPVTDFNLYRYKTILPNNTTIKHWNVLQHACKYTSRVTEGLEIYNIVFGSDWLYYASATPIWSDRIKKYNGIVDHNKKTVIFPEDPTDHMMQAFYSRYGYELDEQPMQVKHKILGIS
jgi:hypothetical protein